MTQRGLPTHGLKPAHVERLELALSKNSYEAFTLHQADQAGIASAEEDVAALEDQPVQRKTRLERIPATRGKGGPVRAQGAGAPSSLPEIVSLRAALDRVDVSLFVPRPS